MSELQDQMGNGNAWNTKQKCFQVSAWRRSILRFCGSLRHFRDGLHTCDDILLPILVIRKDPETLFRHVAGGIKGSHEDLVVRGGVSAKVRMGNVD